jgi:hypothetical protein
MTHGEKKRRRRIQKNKIKKSAEVAHMQGARCAGMVTPCQASGNAAGEKNAVGESKI